MNRFPRRAGRRTPAIAKGSLPLVLVVVAISLAAFATADAKTPPLGTGASVTVVARETPKIECLAVDSHHIEVRTNTSWRFTAETIDGTRTREGGATGVTPVRVTIPTGTVAYAVTMER